MYCRPLPNLYGDASDPCPDRPKPSAMPDLSLSARIFDDADAGAIDPFALFDEWYSQARQTEPERPPRHGSRHRRSRRAPRRPHGPRCMPMTTGVSCSHQFRHPQGRGAAVHPEAALVFTGRSAPAGPGAGRRRDRDPGGGRRLFRLPLAGLADRLQRLPPFAAARQPGGAADRIRALKSSLGTEPVRRPRTGPAIALYRAKSSSGRTANFASTTEYASRAQTGWPPGRPTALPESCRGAAHEIVTAGDTVGIMSIG